jgi:hypothetical protein
MMDVSSSPAMTVKFCSSAVMTNLRSVVGMPFEVGEK